MDALMIFLTNWLEAHGFLIILLLFFAKNVIWKRNVLISISIFFSSLLVIHACISIPYLLFIDFFLFLVLPIFLCTKKKWYNFCMIFPSLFFFILLYVLPDMMVNYTFQGKIELNTSIRFIQALGADIVITGILIYIFLRSRKEKIDLRLCGSEIGIFCLYFLFTVFETFMLHFWTTYATKPVYVFGVGIITILFTLTLLLTYLTYLFTRRKNKRLASDVCEFQNYLSLQLQYLQSHSENQSELKRLQHDLKNHLQVLSELHHAGNYGEAEKYLKKLSEQSDAIKQLHFTGNQVADIVFSSQKQKACAYHISFYCEGQFRALNFIEPIDVCTVLSNILDNAIEATKEVADSYIRIEGIQHTNYFMLKVSNPVTKNIRIKNNYLPTSKKDADRHGIGISNIGNIVEKYNGNYELSCEDNIFVIRIILPFNA